MTEQHSSMPNSTPYFAASAQPQPLRLDLLSAELKHENLALAQAAKTLTELEADQPQLAAETARWVDASLTTTVDDDADFNPETKSAYPKIENNNLQRLNSKPQPLARAIDLNKTSL